MKTTQNHSPSYGDKSRKDSKKKGFTLIELSIVLVIIGLIVGGVLVGQDLIKAAEVRAQITQIEKYNTAVNTFRVKFNAIPGDMATSTATQFGFTTGAGCAGTAQGGRDGNGLLDAASATTAAQLSQGGGETGLFWADLSSSVGGNLVDGSFAGIYSETAVCGAAVATAGAASTTVAALMPSGKLRGTAISVYDGGAGGSTPLTAVGAPLTSTTLTAAAGSWAGAGYNWYSVSGVTGISSAGVPTTSAPITVIQAYNIDKKVDDGYPTTGNVLAAYLSSSAITGAGATASGAITAGSTTCFDDGNATANPYVYSITYNNGNSGACALSFRFQ